MRIRKNLLPVEALTVWGAGPTSVHVAGTRVGLPWTVPPLSEEIVTEAPLRAMDAVGAVGGVVVCLYNSQSTVASKIFQPLSLAAVAVLSWKKKKTRRSTPCCS